MSIVVEDSTLRDRVKVFADRFHAGKVLAERLKEYKGKEDTYILAIPAGGIQVAFPIAKALELPLDLVLTRKIHIPWNKEAGFGAISWDGIMLLNEPLVASLGLTEKAVERCVKEENEIIERRLRRFRGNKPFPVLKNKTVLIIDDGLASGFSMLTTAQAVKERGAKKIVIAVPTAPANAINLIKPHAHEIVCLNIRHGPFFAVADAYQSWYDVEDRDVDDLLERL
jgi:predicted phosphoribosyltransferase